MPATEHSSDPDDRALLISAVREAGALALEHFKTEVKTWTKQDQTPVSEIDLKVNQLLQTRLIGARPGYGWLSEETTDDKTRLNRRRVFIIDPIDGTRAFLQHKPHWTISAALLEAGQPVLAAVYNPVSDEFYHAAWGRGAWCNDSAIKPSTRAKLPGAKMLATRAGLRDQKLNPPWPEMTIESRNSVAYRLCLAASGEFDALLVHSVKSEWDVAAGWLILKEAGGRISHHDGSELVFNKPIPDTPGFMAAGPALYQAMYDHINGRKN